jgi:chorismate mutase/prephenate dehydratase
MPAQELVYFGKPGSFTHLVAGRIAGKAKLISRATVGEVFNYVKKKKTARGIVPIENSSAGMIVDTVENLVNEPGVVVQDEYALNVKLALLGTEGRAVKKIYSHFAPFHHSQGWLKKHYPGAEQCVVDSTSAAARLAAKDKNAASIGPMSAAKKYRLDVLHFPIGDTRQNLTQFFLLGHEKTVSPGVRQTSVAAVLKNQVGSLCNFLTCFAKEEINLKRIMSQPIVGQPNNYVFFISVEAPISDKAMKRALQASRTYCKVIRVLGSYPVHPPFES